MRAILVTPATRTMKVVDFNGTGEHIRHLLGVDLFDLVRNVDEAGNCAYLDDEGLLKEPEHFTVVCGDVYAGPMLFVGPADEEGGETPCTLTKEWMLENVRPAYGRRMGG